MSDPFSRKRDADDVDEQAAGWIWRLDHGLSPDEQDAFFDWLAADPRNAEVLQRHHRNWKRLDKLADWRPEHGKRPNPDLLAPPRRARWRPPFLLMGLAAAAALVVAAGLWNFFTPPVPRGEPESGTLRPENRQTLADGSTVKLNAGAAVTVLYSPAERRVRLDRGEGFFLVTKDPARPFVVEAHGIEVRAVGTAFNVALGAGVVDVLVAEGVVRVGPGPASEQTPGVPAVAGVAVLQANQEASITLSSRSSPPQVSTVTRREMQRALGWQHGLMTFDQRPLSGIVAELNLLNEKQLVLGDPTVAGMEFSGTIRSDNVEGFVRLLEAGFGVRGEALGPTEIVLRAL